MAVDKSVKTWLQDSNQQLIFNLRLENSLLSVDIVELESVNGNPRILSDCQLLWENQKPILRLVHAYRFYLLYSVRVFEHSAHFKGWELDIDLHNVLSYGLVSSVSIFVPLLAVQVLKVHKRLIRNGVKCSGVALWHKCKFRILNEITLFSPVINPGLVM